MACNVQEKKTRASPPSIVSRSPSATGMIWNNSSSAAPTAVQPPQVGARDGGEHRERNRRSGIVSLPAVQIHRHQRDPNPRADDHQDNPDIVEGVADQRRIEGVEYRSE